MEENNKINKEKPVKNKHGKERKSRGNYITKGIVVLIALAIVAFILVISPNYKNEEITDRTNVIINNNNITAHLKKEVYIDEEGNIYLSMEDLENFYDAFIYYDEQYNQIITTDNNKIGVMVVGENEIKVNDSIMRTAAPVIQKDDTYYLPIYELQDVYHMEATYIEETDILLLDSLDRAQQKADASKNLSVKSRMKFFSRTVDKVEQGEKVVLISTSEDGWAEIRTERGKIGYVKENKLANIISVREEMPEEEKLQKVSLVWDYYSEYVTAPDRSGTTIEGINVVSPTFFALKRLGQGDIIDKAGEEGQAYVEWAKEQGYEVWALFSNESMIETTSEIMNDFKLREKTIKGIVDLAVKYGVDGINIDFENMYMEDKDLFTRFIIELAPRLKDYGMTLSVDVTAPDGGETWSQCFDRYNLAKNVDYMIFMGYDQHGESSTEAGSVAGYDWIKLALDKFVGKQEGVPKEKMILGIPFYTRVWYETEGEDLDSDVIDMADTESYISRRFPSSVERVWNEETKQNYIEYNNGSTTYKMWIEDNQSIQVKLNLAREYELGGVAFWAKDREDESVWEVVKQYLEE